MPSFAAAVKWKPALHSARTERYKLIKDIASGEGQLYDLKDDPGENRNLAAESPALTEVEAILQAQLDQNTAHGKLVPGRGSLSETVRERLRALGYEEAEPPPEKERAPVPR